MADYEKMDDVELLNWWSRYHRRETVAKDMLQSIEYELQKRLEQRNATELFHPDLSCKLVRPTPTYDLGMLASLRELLPPGVIDSAFTPAHDEVDHVPDQWDMRTCRSWGKKYGTNVAAVLERAEMPSGPTRLKITEKEVPHA